MQKVYFFLGMLYHTAYHIGHIILVPLCAVGNIVYAVVSETVFRRKSYKFGRNFIVYAAFFTVASHKIRAVVYIAAVIRRVKVEICNEILRFGNGFYLSYFGIYTLFVIPVMVMRRSVLSGVSARFGLQKKFVAVLFYYFDIAAQKVLCNLHCHKSPNIYYVPWQIHSYSVYHIRRAK